MSALKNVTLILVCVIDVVNTVIDHLSVFGK